MFRYIKIMPEITVQNIYNIFDWLSDSIVPNFTRLINKDSFHCISFRFSRHCGDGGSSGAKMYEVIMHEAKVVNILYIC